MKKLEEIQEELEDFLFLESLDNDEEEDDLLLSGYEFPDELDYEFDVDEYEDDDE